MSFIDTYMKNHSALDISASKRKMLSKLEQKLDAITKKSQSPATFLDAIQKYGDEIGDLIERVNQWKSSTKGFFSTFKFAYSIAIEVFQIVNAMHAEIVPTGLSKDEEWQIKLEFGKQLTYFIWKTVGLLDKRLNWVPFKKTFEKKIVFWIAGMGLETFHNMFEANKEISTFAVNNKAVLAKAL